jgi:hypothetical protein
MDPFASESIKLYKPISVGEHFVEELTFRSPVVKDILYAGSRYSEGTIPFTVCLMSTLSGEPESVLEKMVPEDWANAVVIVDRSYQRFCGHINLFKKEEKKNPTKGAAATANIPPKTSSGTSAE